MPFTIEILAKRKFGLDACARECGHLNSLNNKKDDIRVLIYNHNGRNGKDS